MRKIMRRGLHPDYNGNTEGRLFEVKEEATVCEYSEEWDDIQEYVENALENAGEDVERYSWEGEGYEINYSTFTGVEGEEILFLDGKPIEIYYWQEEETVLNEWGTEIYYDAAVQLMDDEIREELHMELAPCSDQEFFDAYVERHEEKFGEVWELAKANPTY